MSLDCVIAEAKTRRIERRHQAGKVFQSSPELRWLYIELALANGGQIEWTDEDRLSDYIEEPIGGSLSSDGDHFASLMKQGAIYVENSKFHCTMLRDWFIKRFVAHLVKWLDEYEPGRIKFVWHITVFAVIVGLFMYSVKLAVLAAALYILNAVDVMRRYRKWKKLREMIARMAHIVELGGFDEPEIIRHLEASQGHGMIVPSILYALLRLPRRNVEHVVSTAYRSLNEEQAKRLQGQWQVFLDSKLNYTEQE